MIWGTETDTRAEADTRASDILRNSRKGEQLLVWTWRRLAVGIGDCPLIVREFVEICGSDAAEVLATLCTFLQALAYTARRQLRIGYPGYPGLTADERQLLALIALAQAEDEEFFVAHLEWVAKATLRPALAIATRALGTALKAHGISLPVPSSGAAARDPDPPCGRVKDRY